MDLILWRHAEAFELQQAGRMQAHGIQTRDQVHRCCQPGMSGTLLCGQSGAGSGNFRPRALRMAAGKEFIEQPLLPAGSERRALAACQPLLEARESRQSLQALACRVQIADDEDEA